MDPTKITDTFFCGEIEKLSGVNLKSIFSKPEGENPMPTIESSKEWLKLFIQFHKFYSACAEPPIKLGDNPNSTEPTDSSDSTKTDNSLDSKDSKESNNDEVYKFRCLVNDLGKVYLTALSKGYFGISEETLNSYNYILSYENTSSVYNEEYIIKELTRLHNELKN